VPRRTSLRRIEVVLPEGKRLVLIRCTTLLPPGVIASRRALSIASYAAASVGNEDGSPLGDFVCTRVVEDRLYRSVRALRIYEGTTEIRRLVIANELLRPTAPAASGSAATATREGA
jgi:hypothetical protein